MTLRSSGKSQRILVIGAGVFGLTLSLELHRRGYKDITILDRYLPPVPDGSSVDISRVIRPDYADPFYAKMALEAMEGWNAEFSSFFHRSGLVQLAQIRDHPYTMESRKNLRAMGLTVDNCRGSDIGTRFPIITGNTATLDGYFNKESGWVDARQSIAYLAKCCTEAGIAFMTGSHGTVTALLTSGMTVKGVRTKSGTSVVADTCICATGAWTTYLVDMTSSSISTGQPVGFVQLTPQEAKDLKDCPIIIDLTSGWFCFPPTPGDHVLKMARHGYGYETDRPTASSLSSSSSSAPLLESNNAKSGFIPADADQALRDGLEMFFPQFRDREFFKRRLCWYTDTPTGDFIVDYHPRYDNLFLACGGSGHAFKFLPVLGKYTADSFERVAAQVQKDKWAWRPSDVPISKGDGSRGGPPRRILTGEEQARL